MTTIRFGRIVAIELGVALGILLAEWLRGV